MSNQTAIIIGAWIFAAATVLAKNVSGGFMLVAFIVAIIVSVFS